jgi:hypothetical protein
METSHEKVSGFTLATLPQACQSAGRLSAPSSTRLRVRHQVINPVKTAMAVW